MPNSNCILHLVTVGFHHRHGAVVELAYPPLARGSDDHVTERPPHSLPDKWKHLASLALPDGAHNYLKDVVYFTLPSLEKEEIVVFGVASYRQMDSHAFAQQTPDVTRNTVQKSLIALMRFPVFSFMAHHLSQLIEQFFTEGGFTLERLKDAYVELDEKLSAVLAHPSTYQGALLFDLSAANFVRVYGRDALTLFKLLLLERRVLFAGESAGSISVWIATLLSLLPDLLLRGLSHCCLVDPSWISERACWPVLCGPSTTSSKPKPDETTTQQQNSACSDDTSVLFVENTSTLLQPPADDLPSGSTTDQGFDPASAPSLAISEKVTLPVSLASSGAPSPHPSELQSTDLMPAQLDEPIYVTSPENPLVGDNSLFSPFPTDDWGFPLALFTKSYVLPMFLPLISLDLLLESTSGPNLFPPTDSPDRPASVSDRCVRAFLAGATNPLLRTHKHLAEVIVTSLSPVDGLTESDGCHSHGSLTSLFDGSTLPRKVQTAQASIPPEGLLPSLSGGATRQSSNPSRSSNTPKRSDPVIHFLPPSSATAGLSPRTFPVSLAQALRLTRVDRAFIDELNKTVGLWYQGRSAVQQLCQLAPSDDLSVLLQGDEKTLDRTLDRLLPEQRTVLLRFPSSAILDLYVRQQFQSYLRSLLLNAEGYGSNSGDYGTHYVNCLRSTRAFLVWRRQFMPEKLFRVSKPQLIAPMLETTTDDAALQETEDNETPTDSATVKLFPLVGLGSPSPFSSAAEVLAVHPGRRHAEPDDWDQLVGGFKKFRELAADRGRRLMSQGVQGLSKLSTDLNASFRFGMSSSVVSRFSDAFRSLLNSASQAASR
ncbi:late secretory pathway protein avl9 [Clonorchis sinensis]|uniref:Late secretory pathway protein avl9 n=1 Tax=Clonorchis sinensis TaxID=79923 RepID=A0A8T1MWG7_CLOSI|nr:late secretory pathway protein avl9 [Clonorchis sinensis]